MNPNTTDIDTSSSTPPNTTPQEEEEEEELSASALEPNEQSRTDLDQSQASEFNYLLSESGLYPQTASSSYDSETNTNKTPPSTTGLSANTTTPGPHRRPNPNHSLHQQPLSTPPNPIVADPVPFSYLESSLSTWRHDPLASPDWDSAGAPGALCTRRVKKDLSTIFTEPLPGIFAVPQDDNLFLVHSLIVGPFDTPYEGGFFHFVVRFGPSYPIHPPRVRLLTTGGGRVRFNPNLYKNGKVCLSILGTWRGPAWSPAANLSSVLLSLQSLLNENPYHNEPGFEQERNIGDSARYNTIITHETLRVAVVEQLERIMETTTTTTSSSGSSSSTSTSTTGGYSQVPLELKRVIETSFLEYYDHYADVCTTNLHKDGSLMEDPFGEIRGRFSYLQILKRLRRLKGKLKAAILSEPSSKTPPSSDDDDYFAEEEEEEEEEEDSGSGAVSIGASGGGGGGSGGDGSGGGGSIEE